MPLPHHPHSGDGASGDGAPTCGPSDRPIPPGQLVVTAIVPASEVEPGPRLPLYLDRVPAGFPSPADDYVEGRLDLRDLADANSPSCYFLRVEGESMVGAGIHHGDVVVVDRRSTRSNGDVVVASINGELTLRRFMRRGAGARARVALLAAANPAYDPIELREGQELVVWGVVTGSYRQHRRSRR